MSTTPTATAPTWREGARYVTCSLLILAGPAVTVALLADQPRWLVLPAALAQGVAVVLGTLRLGVLAEPGRSEQR